MIGIPYKDLFVAMEKRKIRYLVAGGMAVNLHQVQRATVDLDLILHLETSNVLRFIELMSESGFVPRVPVKAAEFADPLKRKTWIEEKGMLVFSFINPKNPLEVIDVFSEEPKPFEELARRKLEVTAFGVKISVLGEDDLIELKLKAGRPKDLFDVQEIRSRRKDK